MKNKTYKDWIIWGKKVTDKYIAGKQFIPDPSEYKDMVIDAVLEELPSVDNLTYSELSKAYNELNRQ
jgi:hypothetical protein